MRPRTSSAYQSVCAFRSALASASKYDRTTVLVSVAGAVASLVVMGPPLVRGTRDRTRRSRALQAANVGADAAGYPARASSEPGWAGLGRRLPPQTPTTAESEVPASVRAAPLCKPQGIRPPAGAMSNTTRTTAAITRKRQAVED